jgi:hypothetical protein
LRVSKGEKLFQKLHRNFIKFQNSKINKNKKKN